MVEKDKEYTVSYLYDTWYQLKTGNYPLLGFQTYDKVTVLAIDNDMAICTSPINRTSVYIPVIYLIDDCK